MPLPISPPPRATDVATLGWVGITVRIAWTLLGLGIKPKPALMADLRAHVLYHLHPTTPVPHAEDVATRLTEEFVQRGTGRGTPWPSDWDVPIAQRWRRTFDGLLDEPSRLVFRKHYGDRRALEWIVQHVSAGGKPVDLAVIAAVRDGLRDAARHIGRQDGLGTETWAPERLDRFLRRLAAYAPPPCPRVLDVSEGCYPEHVATCARCDRMLRLLQHDELSIDDLQVPTVGARPTQQAKVLALHLHPKGRKARRRLRDALGEQVSGHPVLTMGPDLLVLDGERPDRYVRTLHLAAEIGEPAREHIRGVLLEGPGHWTSHGLVGPLPEQAAQEVLFRPWGTVDAIGELPPILPPPPPATGIWALVAAVGAIGLLMLPSALSWLPWQHAPPARSAVFAPAERGTWVQFDAPDLAAVSIIAEQDRTLVTKLAGRGAHEKVALAVGDGTFRTWVEGDGALVVISDRPVTDLETIVAAARAEPNPLAALAGALALREEVTVYWHHQ